MVQYTYNSETQAPATIMSERQLYIPKKRADEMDLKEGEVHLFVVEGVPMLSKIVKYRSDNGACRINVKKELIEDVFPGRFEVAASGETVKLMLNHVGNVHDI